MSLVSASAAAGACSGSTVSLIRAACMAFSSHVGLVEERTRPRHGTHRHARLRFAGWRDPLRPSPRPRRPSSSSFRDAATTAARRPSLLSRSALPIEVSASPEAAALEYARENYRPVFRQPAYEGCLAALRD